MSFEALESKYLLMKIWLISIKYLKIQPKKLVFSHKNFIKHIECKNININTNGEKKKQKSFFSYKHDLNKKKKEKKKKEEWQTLGCQNLAAG
jgi:hypothetical protein